jgi:hypothetical protein
MPDGETTRQHAIRTSGGLSLDERLRKIDEILANIDDKVSRVIAIEIRVGFLERVVYGLVGLFAAQAVTVVVGVIIWALKSGGGG